MPPDSELYGIRKPKTTKKEISSSTTLAFTSQLSSLLSSATSPSTSRPTSGRPRPSSKSDLFTAHNKNTKKRALHDLEDIPSTSTSQNGDQADPSTLHRSKRKMEEKARLYSAMKRGDYVPNGHEPEALIDFDRKWAENAAAGGRGNDLDTSSSSGADSDSDDGNNNNNNLVDYEDEYGRARRGTPAEAARMDRKKHARLLGAEELDRMSARPKAPQELIYGDTVQSLAFNPDEPVAQAMEALAAKRDRSATPPDAVHYEAAKEIRSKGVGFYAFSRDEEGRKGEMEALERERRETERVREEREARRERRRREVEGRRREVGEKRARRMADEFLDGLAGEGMGGGGGGGGERDT